MMVDLTAVVKPNMVSIDEDLMSAKHERKGPGVEYAREKESKEDRGKIERKNQKEKPNGIT